MDLKNFIRFFKDEAAHGFDFLRIENFSIFGRGLKTLTTLDKNSKILTIPKKFLISVDTANNDEIFGPMLKSINPSLSEDNILSTYLLFIKSQNTDNRYIFERTYISILPVKYNTFYFFNNEEIEPCHGSTLYKTGELLKKQIKNDFHKLENVFERNVFSFTIEEYEWALFTLWSRGMDFNLQEKMQRIIVPFADLLNHSSEVDQCHLYETSTGDVHIYAGKNYRENEQIFINYGNMSNTRFLLNYGFIIDNNVYDSYDLYVSTDQTAPHFTNKNLIFKKYNLKINSIFTLKQQLLIPPELLIYLRIQRATFEDLTSEKAFDTMLNKKHELMILKNLSESLQNLLSGFRYTINDLENMNFVNGNSFKAAKVSIGEQTILVKAKMKLKNMIDEMMD